MVNGDVASIAAAFALLGTFLIFLLLVFVGLYVYFAWAFMTIARKLKYKKAWLAWIPLAQFALFPILAKKKESAWPWVFILLVPFANFVFMIIWTWKIYEYRKYPGALALISLASFIPFLGFFAGIANLVVWGLVAWHDR